MKITYTTNSGKNKTVEYINTIGQYARVMWGTGQISSVPIDRCAGIPASSPVKLETSGSTIWLDVIGVPDELQRVSTLLDNADDYQIEGDKVQVLAGDKLMILTCSSSVISALQERENIAADKAQADLDRAMKPEKRSALDQDRRSREYKLITAGQRGELCGAEQIAYEGYLQSGWIDIEGLYYADGRKR